MGLLNLNELSGLGQGLKMPWWFRAGDRGMFPRPSGGRLYTWRDRAAAPPPPTGEPLTYGHLPYGATVMYWIRGTAWTNGRGRYVEIPIASVTNPHPRSFDAAGRAKIAAWRRSRAASRRAAAWAARRRELQARPVLPSSFMAPRPRTRGTPVPTEHRTIAAIRNQQIQNTISQQNALTTPYTPSAAMVRASSGRIAYTSPAASAVRGVAPPTAFKAAVRGPLRAATGAATVVRDFAAGASSLRLPGGF